MSLTSIPDRAADISASAMVASGMKKGDWIKTCRFADMIMNEYSCLIAAHCESGPDVRIWTGTSPYIGAVALTGKYAAANKFSLTALYQSTINTACRTAARSEERRVGKECRSRWAP